MPLSTYSGNKALDLILRGVAWTPPTEVFFSLHTADPGNTGADEVTLGAWPAYVRMSLDGGGAIADGFSAAASKTTDNELEILWPANDGAGDVIVTHGGIWDAATAGNLLLRAPLLASKTLHPDDEFIFHAGDIDWTAV